MEHSLRKEVALDRVLIGRLQDDLVDPGAVLKPEAAGPLGRRVEGDLDLDPPLVAKEVDPLNRNRGVPTRRDSERVKVFSPPAGIPLGEGWRRSLVMGHGS